MRHLYESGAEYSTVYFHRSGIAKFHVGINGVSVGEHPLVSQAVKTVFRLRPPLPQYQSTFDLVPVLAYVQSLHRASITTIAVFQNPAPNYLLLYFQGEQHGPPRTVPTGDKEGP